MEGKYKLLSSDNRYYSNDCGYPEMILCFFGLLWRINVMPTLCYRRV